MFNQQKSNGACFWLKVGKTRSSANTVSAAELSHGERLHRVLPCLAEARNDARLFPFWVLATVPVLPMRLLSRSVPVAFA